MRRTRRLVVILGILSLCIAVIALNTAAQRVPTDIDKPSTTPKPNRPRPIRTPRPNVPTKNAASPTMAQSNNFLDLGDSFREKEKWNAAEAAYKEAVELWPGNADALVELGYLHLNRNRLQEAQAVYSKLRGINSSYAANLLVDINKRKAER